MKKVLVFAVTLAVVLPLAQVSLAQNVQRNPIVIHELNHTTTPLPLREMTQVAPHNQNRLMPEHKVFGHAHIGTVEPFIESLEVMPLVGTTSGLNFSGITGNQGGGYDPPDTNASVGATQVVETVNLAYSVYDKTTGALTFGPTSVQTLYTPLGGQCGTGNLSDPVVNYDKVAGRWVITLIAFNNTFTINDACVAVSTGSDATGTYNLYAFSYGSQLPDYPKVGVWPDAYYITTDSFKNGGSFTGADTCALDRTNMLAGNAATAICFQRGQGDYAVLPADADGATAPPAGAPNYQMELATSTKVNIFQFHVDFVTPSNSTYTGPTQLTVTSYTDACAATGTCIVEPTPGEKLDALGDRLMFRLPYRNFGDHEALVFTHSIKASGSGKAPSAVRWYELRSPGASPTIYQSGTVGGGSSTVSKWMPSIAQDKVGNIALGYSKSNSTTKPSIEYVGRISTDTLGSMESPKLIVTGTGVQQGGGARWGDYSSMAIDPADDCTFWYTQEYYTTNGASWATRMASFKFTACH